MVEKVQGRKRQRKEEKGEKSGNMTMKIVVVVDMMVLKEFFIFIF